MAEGPLPFEDIPAMEAAFGLSSAGGQGNLRPYIVHNDWWVAKDWWSRLLTYQFRPSALKLPGLYRTRVFGLLARGMGKAETLAATADLIQTKRSTGRIRLFYLSHPPAALTVKMIHASNTAHAARMRAEHDARTTLASLNLPLTSPPLIGDMIKAEDAIGICEEVVTGRRFSARRDGAMFSDQLVPGLSAYWQARGTVEKTLSDVLDLPACLKAVDQVADKLPDDVLHALKATALNNPRVICGQCHGDLSPSNLTVQGGHLILLDWERSHFGPLALDLIHPVAKKPALLPRILPELEARHCPGGTTLADLFAAFILKRLTRRPSAAPRLARFYKQACDRM
ncbi:MAG: hypothetical protein Alpg2KO_15390 [Alphaproteobacteria bacterium]